MRYLGLRRSVRLQALYPTANRLLDRSNSVIGSRARVLTVLELDPIFAASAKVNPNAIVRLAQPILLAKHCVQRNGKRLKNDRRPELENSCNVAGTHAVDRWIMSVIAHRVCATDPAHKPTHLSFDQRLQNQVIMIRHQLKSQQLHLIKLQSLVQNFLEGRVVALFVKDGRPQVSSIQGVIQSARFISSWRSWQAPGLKDVEPQKWGLTLFQLRLLPARFVSSEVVFLSIS